MTIKQLTNQTKPALLALTATSALAFVLPVQAAQQQNANLIAANLTTAQLNPAQLSPAEVASLKVEVNSLALESDKKPYAQALNFKSGRTEVLKTDLFYDLSLSAYDANQLKPERDVLKTNFDGQLASEPRTFDWQPLETKLTLGYDLVKKGAKDYFGVGLSLGVSSPRLDTSFNSVGDPSKETAGLESNIATESYNATTSFDGHKIGPKILFGKSLGQSTALYGQVSYVWQSYKVRNSALDYSNTLDGDTFSYELGMRYQPLKTKKVLNSSLVEPTLFFTVGVGYSKSNLEDMNVELNQQQLKLDSDAFDLSNTTLNFGVGYSF